MSNKQIFNATAFLLLLAPILLSSWKINKGYLSKERLFPESSYDVKFQFDLKGDSSETFVRIFLPENNEHQKISKTATQTDGFNFENIETPYGKKGEWRNFQTNKQHQLNFQFNFQGKAMKYNLDKDLSFESIPEHLNVFTKPNEHIQSEDPKIRSFANNLSPKNDNLTDALKAYFNYVQAIPAIQTSELTDALTTLEENQASCNGKSRLFVALCRAKGIPARVVGGIILETTQKRTSHLWAEVWVQGNWIPFDALNNHFAYLPANFLELYRGDQFLIGRTPNIDFDYQFDIQKRSHYNSEKALAALTLWNIPNQMEISTGLLKTILLLPICALIVALFRNVVGMKTLGVFLPALIAISIDVTGLWFGLAAFILVTLIVSSLHFPLEKWGLLYTPKLVVLLIGVILTVLMLVLLGAKMGLPILTSLIFFPIIILAITAEKFARTIVEDGYGDALKLMGQTLIVTLFCYFVFASDVLVGIFLTFPEIYAVLIGIVLLLGRWIGLRVSEYKRFSWLLS